MRYEEFMRSREGKDLYRIVLEPRPTREIRLVGFGYDKGAGTFLKINTFRAKYRIVIITYEEAMSNVMWSSGVFDHHIRWETFPSAKDILRRIQAMNGKYNGDWIVSDTQTDVLREVGG